MDTNVEVPENSKNVAMISDVGNHMQSLAHHDKRDKLTDKVTNEKKKGMIHSNKSQKINATRASFKEKKGTTQGKRNDKLAELMVTKELNTFIATHVTPVNKNESRGKGPDGSRSVDTTPILVPVVVPPVLMEANRDNVPVNFHRDPGIHESKFFDGPMFGDGRPTPEDRLPTLSTNTGDRRIEVDVFVDAKDSVDSSVEEWEMEGVVDGSTHDHQHSVEGNNLA
jgi:hypothetical protein